MLRGMKEKALDTLSKMRDHVISVQALAHGKSVRVRASFLLYRTAVSLAGQLSYI